MCIYICIYVYVCMYVCMYVYIYIYIYIILRLAAVVADEALAALVHDDHDVRNLSLGLASLLLLCPVLAVGLLLY